MILFLISSTGENEDNITEYSTEILFERTVKSHYNPDVDGIDTIVVLIDGHLVKESNYYDPEFYITNMEQRIKNHYYVDWYDSINCFYPMNDITKYSVENSQEVKTIQGYKCKKKTFRSLKDTVSVYFTSELDGEFGYKPTLEIEGCILEMALSDRWSRETWKAIDINTKSHKSVEHPSDFINDESKEYKEIVAKRQDDFPNPPIVLNVGERAPNFSGRSLSNEPINLDNYKDQVVVLNFWFIGCPGCVAEMPDLNKIVKHFDGKEVQFISFAPNSRNDLYKFLRRKQFDFKILPGGGLTEYHYGVTGFPTTIIVDKAGKIANTYYFQTIEHIGYQNLMNAIDDQLSK